MHYTKRFSSYFVIGLGTTLGTFTLWNIFITIGKALVLDKTNFDLIFSCSQLIASFIMIFPSFYLNRRITFKDKARKNSKSVSVLKAYFVYILAAVLASLATYGLQKIYSFESIEIFIVTNIKVGRLFLQVIGVLVGMVVNFFGQKIWIYN